MVILERLSVFVMVAMVAVWTSKTLRHGSKMILIMIPTWFMGIHSFAPFNLLHGVVKRVFMVLILLNFLFINFVVMVFKNSAFAL